MSSREDLRIREALAPTLPPRRAIAAWSVGTHFSQYEIESLLASGGMAEVWRAKIKGAEGFERRVVLKTMLTQFLDRSDLVEMFVREATLAAQFNHPNIVDVFDFGQLEGRYFIAMEYVPGVTLRFAHRRMHARSARLPVAMVLHVMKDVCEALQHMHDLEDSLGPMGVIHRDLSPDNVILSTSSRAKLIDFGAARATERTPPNALFVGKYRYAAPERIQQTGEDRRSDVFSAGVILYECLTGVRPFDGTDAQIMKEVLASRGCDPREFVPELPARVGKLVMKATAQRPEDRFEDAQELAGAIGMCLSELGSFSKEREVTAALSQVLEPTDQEMTGAGGLAPREAVPEVVVPETSDHPSDVEVALSEMEILEASGPIRLRQAPGAGTGERRIPGLGTGERRVPPPAPALAGSRMPTAPGRSAVEQAMELFDRGVAFRNEARFDEALESWELALALAPENRVYQASVRRLREELAAIPEAEDGNDETTAVGGNLTSKHEG